jgi:hypothetical protein
MKNILRVGLLLAGVFAALAISGNAQVNRQYAAHIPFDFKVGGKVLKAGDYRITPLSGITNQRFIAIQNQETGKATLVGQASIDSSGTSTEGRLTFIGNNDEWLLSEVTTPGFSLKLKSRSEDNDKIASAKKLEETQTVEINR